MQNKNDNYYISLEDIYGYVNYENKINIEGSVLFFLESKSLKTYILEKYGVEALNEVPAYLFLNNDDFYKTRIEYETSNIQISNFKEEMTDVKVGGLEDELFLPNRKELNSLLDYSPNFNAIKHIDYYDKLALLKKYSKSKNLKLAKYVLEFKELTRLRKEASKKDLNVAKEILKSNRQIREQMIIVRHKFNYK